MRSLGLLIGFAADQVFGDPRRFHPVAGFGQVALRVEQRLYADGRARGAAYSLVLVGTATAAGIALERCTRGHPLAHTLATAGAAWSVLGARSLDNEAVAVSRNLTDDLPAARQRLTHLVGRDTSDLDESGITRAVVESLAENTSDAVVAPLVLGAAFGIPGLLGHRAANTLDAMVGHRSPRYQRFGWASARLDDLLNLPGSRTTAALAVALGPDPRGAVRAWRRDAGGHSSPNAGPVEAAFAGALGITLGGTNVYGSIVDHRVRLGDGPAPRAPDVARARRLARRIDLGALALAVLSTWRPRRRQQPGR